MEINQMVPQEPLWQRYLKRFILIYFVLYIIPYGFEYFYELDRDAYSFWPAITTWFGEMFLGFSFDLEHTRDTVAIYNLMKETKKKKIKFYAKIPRSINFIIVYY